MKGVEVAFYMVHSMAAGQDFEQRDVLAARNFATAAQAAGVRRIIYLGGLGDSDTALSGHLRSRQETGAVLRESGVPVTEFRAPVIVGSGSLSFEIIRYLTERLPVMICPRWLYTRAQPIAIRNVLDYLVAALDTPESTGRIIEIGGADVLTYGDLLRGYAKARGLKRWLVPVPVLTPRLYSYWVHLVTPVPATIARPLIQGLRNDVESFRPEEIIVFYGGTWSPYLWHGEEFDPCSTEGQSVMADALSALLVDLEVAESHIVLVMPPQMGGRYAQDAPGAAACYGSFYRAKVDSDPRLGLVRVDTLVCSQDAVTCDEVDDSPTNSIQWRTDGLHYTEEGGQAVIDFLLKVSAKSSVSP